MASPKRRSRHVFAGVGLAMLAVAVIVVAFVPRNPTERLVSTIENPGAVATIRFTVDSVDGARGTMKVRLAVGPADEPLPAEGITVFVTVDSISTVKLQPGSGSQEATIEVPLTRGEISAYPFDRYEAQIHLAAERGTPAQPSANPDDPELVFNAEGFNSAVGFDVEIEPTDDHHNATTLRFHTSRSHPTVIWASTMMVIYWLLSFAVISVTALVVLGLREWESRHLAWLATMIFAFASFRATAPGTPPMGVYLDYAAFFWSEALVALSLMVLVGFYLLGLRDQQR